MSCVDVSPQQNHQRPYQTGKTHVAYGEFFKWRKYPSAVFDFTEEASVKAAFLIDKPSGFTRCDTVAARRDGRLYALMLDGLDDRAVPLSANKAFAPAGGSCNEASAYATPLACHSVSDSSAPSTITS